MARMTNLFHLETLVAPVPLVGTLPKSTFIMAGGHHRTLYTICSYFSGSVKIDPAIERWQNMVGALVWAGKTNMH